MNSYFNTATHIMCYIASASKNETLTSSEAIATRLAINAAVVRKLAGILVQKELLKTVRGIKGGYVLARNAELISLKDIFEAVEALSPDFWGADKMSVKAKTLESTTGDTQKNLTAKLAKAKADMLQSLSLVSIANL